MAIAERLRSYLKKAKIPYDIVPHAQTENFLAAMDHAKIPVSELVKAVILKNRKGQTLMAIIPALNFLDFRSLRRLQGESFHLVSRDELCKFFDDCTDGAVPAIGQAYQMQIVWDDQISEMQELYMEEGDHCGFVHMNTEHFTHIMQSQQHGVFSYPAPLAAS